MILEKIFERLASRAPFLRLIVDHLLCPDMTIDGFRNSDRDLLTSSNGRAKIIIYPGLKKKAAPKKAGAAVERNRMVPAVLPR
jgi:hypothetical protein